MTHPRANGDANNKKADMMWTKEELVQVYILYKNIHGVGLHEHNPELQNLASQLERNVSSIEVQMFMFRNLERLVDSDHGSVNKLTKEVWLECEQSDLLSLKYKIEENTLEDIYTEENDGEIKLKYNDWNDFLLDYFFKETISYEDVGCFPVSENLFKEITNFEFEYPNFVDSIYKEIGCQSFFRKLDQLYRDSTPREYNGRKIRKAKPVYFGFIIFLIHALTEDEAKGLSAANVYDRINHYGREKLGQKWDDINSKIARELLEPIWVNLEDWSVNYKKGVLGLFIRHNPSNSKRKYVSRLERHALLNSHQFGVIIDRLIDKGVRLDGLLSAEEWIVFFNSERAVFKKYDVIKGYLVDDSALQKSVINYLNNYISIHFEAGVTSSENGTYRIPSIPLKFCLKEIPDWPEEPIENYYFRAHSEDIEEDVVNLGLEQVKILFDNNFLSQPLTGFFNLEKAFLFNGKTNRYATKQRIFWLSKNHILNEWMEVDHPTNEQAFIVIISTEKYKEFKEQAKFNFSCYPILNNNNNNNNACALYFRNLKIEDFNEVYNLYNPYRKIEGKIELIGSFTSDRRRCVYQDFNPKFRYTGPTNSPYLVAVKADSKDELIKLEQLPNESEQIYQLPNSFKPNCDFQIRERSSNIKSAFNYYYGNLNSCTINVAPSFIRDHEGINQVNVEYRKDDLLDIPANFNRKLDIINFNAWHASLLNLFNSRKKDDEFIGRSHIGNLNNSGDNLLKYLSGNKNVMTYDFPKLVRELDNSISPWFSKRIMHYWRNLGYIDFQDFGGRIKVSPTSILFLQSKKGLKGFLTGYRSNEFILKLKEFCEGIGVIVTQEEHSHYKAHLFPIKIVLFDKSCDLTKFKRIAEVFDLHFVNDIQNSYNTNYVVYQLACLYCQRSVKEFLEELGDRNNYPSDHHRKRVYDVDGLKWKDTNELLSSLPDLSVIRFEGFKDNSMTHIIRSQGVSKIINDISIAAFSVLKKTVIKVTGPNQNPGEYDLLVPLFLGLPFWIEKGLLLINATIPKIAEVDGAQYRVYKNINIKIINVVAEKLNQDLSK